VALSPRLDSVPQTESALADLRAHVQRAATIYRGRAGQLLRELIALGQEDTQTSRMLRTEVVAPRYAEAIRILTRAQESGEIAADVDLEVLADALWGPIFHRLLVSRM